MSDESFIGNLSGRLTPWLLIMPIILFVLVLTPNKAENFIKPVFKAPVPIKKAKIEPSHEQESPAITQKNLPEYLCGKDAEFLYHSIVVQASSKHQVDHALIKAIIMVE